MKQISKENGFLIICLLILALEAILFSAQKNEINLAYLQEENKFAKIENIFSKVSLVAQAVSIYDQTIHRKIYGKNDKVSLPIASLTKIMTAVIALNNHPDNSTITVSGQAIKEEGDYGFYGNEKWKIEDLAKLTLIGSANDGARALGESLPLFLEKMNEKARKIGMEQTIFLNFTGLDFVDEQSGLPIKAGAFASAADMNVLSLYALAVHGEVFRASALPELTVVSQSGFSHKLKNTNEIIAGIPHFLSLFLFSKTGYTPLAGGNLSVIYQSRAGHKIAITVLGSTQQARFSDMGKIIETIESLEF